MPAAQHDQQLRVHGQLPELQVLQVSPITAVQLKVCICRAAESAMQVHVVYEHVKLMPSASIGSRK